MSGAHDGIGVIKHSNVPEGSAEQEWESNKLVLVLYEVACSNVTEAEHLEHWAAGGFVGSLVPELRK